MKRIGRTELKVGMILRKNITDAFDKSIFGDFAIFRITKIKGYVFGKVLNNSNVRREHAFYIDDKNRKDYWILSEQEGLLYEL
jgi:hypothetical protein